MGSSVGAWQMMAGATSDPGHTMDRLMKAYSGKIYPPKPDEYEISAATGDVIHEMLGDESDYILHNELRPVHIVTARGKGWTSARSKSLRYAGFAATAFSNTLGRRFLNTTIQRTIFSTGLELPFDVHRDVLETRQDQLTAANIRQVALASGSIPFLMPGVRGLGGKDQIFWDGGITDYHFSLPYRESDGIVLLPHFSSYVLAGWFDKKLLWMRKPRSTNMDHVLLICPSDEYVDTLPYKRLTDLKDFYRFKEDQTGRRDYWRAVAERSKELAQELHEVLHNEVIAERIELYK